MRRTRALAASIVLAASVVLVIVVPTGPEAAAAGDAATRVEYSVPVAGPVVDPFRPPAGPYGAGNRGLELATEPGTDVGAAAAGVVRFAGSVAGDRYVTIAHADRLRTTYGPLATVAVAEGQVVTAGQVIGTAGERLLWTARLGAGAYVDPAVLLAASGAPQVHLVRDRPVGGPAGPGPVPREAAAWGLGGG